MSTDAITADGASGELFVLQAGAFGLRSIASGNGSFGALLDAAIDAVRSRDGRTLHLRLNAAERLPVSSLTARGFTRVSERAEFEASVADLPDYTASQLSWATLPDLSDDTLRDAARLLERAGRGDPDWATDDDAFELLPRGQPRTRGGRRRRGHVEPDAATRPDGVRRLAALRPRAAHAGSGRP